MNENELNYVDCTWAKCKNFQRFNTIEIFFLITTDDHFAIEYNFHYSDFDNWKKIVKIHCEDIDEPVLYDLQQIVVDINKLENTAAYYFFTLKSKDYNLYRNINLIFFIEDEEYRNMEKALKKNTWAD